MNEWAMLIMFVIGMAVGGFTVMVVLAWKVHKRTTDNPAAEAAWQAFMDAIRKG